MKELNATILTISLEIVKNNICLGGGRKQNALFFENCARKDVPMPQMSVIGPALP